MLIDSHAHLEMPEFDQDRDEVIQRAKKQGIGYIITIGIQIPEAEKAIALTETYDWIYAAIGIHPHYAQEIGENTYEKLESLASHPKVIAFGEIGLDFFRNLSPREVQLRRFRELIHIGKKLKLPLIIHDRNAHRETLTILEEENGFKGGGVIHCFSGDYDMAKKCVDRGFSISVPGTVTFKNATGLQDVVKKLPLDTMIVETDAPFLAPFPFRGKRNEPAYVMYTAKKIGELKNRSFEEVAQQTTENIRNLFNIPSQS
jgi:TatD DNase family protein